MNRKKNSMPRVSTGVTGLDEVLEGGLLPGRTYLVRGGPGTGKTTLGLHFLTTGAAKGEKTLFVTLGEPEVEIRKNAEALGIDLSGVSFLDLSPTPEFFVEVQTYDLFSPAEVEREPTTKKIVEVVEKLQPSRIFVDAMTQFRYLTTDPYQYRKQVLSFLRFLVEKGATVMFTSEGSVEAPDEDLQFLSDGVIHLEFMPEGRTITVTKFRGSDFRSGRHALKLSDSGIEVFPKLVPEVHWKRFIAHKRISSGVPELDELMHGGLERGTVTIITGPSGAGKTTLGLQFMKEAASRGERSVVYTFEEEPEIMISRCEAIKISAKAMIDLGMLSIVRVEPLRYSTHEFAHLVRREVEQDNARIVMIDSIAGYRLSVRGEDLTAQVRSLSKYLANMGVTVLLINEVEQVTGEFSPTMLGISYLADNIIFIRYLEVRGELRKAIGVLKKRLSDFEKTLREFEITNSGIKVGKPLSNLSCILSGTPRWIEIEEES